MSLKLSSENVQEIEKKFKLEQQNMKQIIADWIKHKEQEREFISKQNNSSGIKNKSNFENSNPQNANIYSSDSSSVAKKANVDTNSEYYEDSPQKEGVNESQNNEAIPETKEEARRVNITGDIYIPDEKIKDPNDYVTIAYKVENGFEIKSIKGDEAEKIENHIVLVKWDEIIPEKPTLDDIDSIMNKANESMKESLLKHIDKLQTPSIQDFKSNDDAEPEVDESKEAEIDGGSIADLASDEEQVETNDDIDDDISIESIAGITADTDEVPNIKDEIPSIVDLASSETEEETPSIEEETPSIEDDMSSIADLASVEDNEQLTWAMRTSSKNKNMLSDFNHSLTKSVLSKENPKLEGARNINDIEEQIKREALRKEISTLEGELEYYPDDRQIMEQLDTAQYKLELLDNDGKDAELSVPATVQNNPEVMEIREDGTIFIGDDYDILSEPQEIEVLALHATKTILEKQIEAIKEQLNHRENVLGEEPLALLESSQQGLLENKNEDEVIEAEIENDEAQGIGM